MPVEAVVAVGTAVGTMEITVSKVELLRELTAMQGVVERKTTIPILSNYLFEAVEGKLSLTATDLDLSLRTSCNAKVKKEGSCTVSYTHLYLAKHMTEASLPEIGRQFGGKHHTTVLHSVEKIEEVLSLIHI